MVSDAEDFILTGDLSFTCGELCLRWASSNRRTDARITAIRVKPYAKRDAGLFRKSFDLRQRAESFKLRYMMIKAKILLAASLLCTLFVLSACNTVKGVGRDFEAMGESMQKAGD